MTATFRAIWPITDPTVPLKDLIVEATDDLPNVTGRARVRVTGKGSWRMAPAAKVPGSGRVSENVLIFEAPAESLPLRCYHQAEAS